MFTRPLKLLSLIVTSALAIGSALAISAPRLAAAKIQSLSARACTSAVYVSIEMDNVKDAPPAASYRYGSHSGVLSVLSSRLQPSGNDTHVIYEYFGRTRSNIPAGSVGDILVNGGKATTFKVSGECPVLGRVAGTAYVDRNANGKRERSEPIFTSAWMKLTDGGAWFVCGWVGQDATYGITVNPGVYFVMPVAPAGYRTTTPRIRSEVMDLGDVSLGNDMGFVADPGSPGDACDQYNPPRP